MEILKDLCITLDYHQHVIDTGEAVFRILNYDDGQYHEEDETIELEFPDIPIPEGIKPLLKPDTCLRYLLVFKWTSKSKANAEVVWLYDSKKSVLYDAEGQKAKDMEVRRFMKLLFNCWQNC